MNYRLLTLRDKIPHYACESGASGSINAHDDIYITPQIGAAKSFTLEEKDTYCETAGMPHQEQEI